MKFRTVILVTLFLGGMFPVSAFGSTWARSYGGSLQDVGRSIQETSDGGFIVSGYTSSYGAGNYDSWVLKLNADGNVTWQNTYGGSGEDKALSIQETSDGGFIVAGYTSSYGAGNYDYWVLKLDADGNVTWQKTYGGPDYDIASSIQETSDGGFIVAGSTTAFGVGNWDWVLKLDANGNVTWQKTYGGSGDDIVSSIQETSGGGFIMAGYNTTFGAGNNDYWVLKLDTNGNVTWQRTYGGSDSDVAYSIQETSDGGFIVAGSTYSYGAGNNDSWVLKLDADGNVTWQRTYGGSGFDGAHSIQETSDSGFIVAGSTSSYGTGTSDSWVLKLDADGNVIWQKTYGGSPNSDYVLSIQETSGGGFIMAGYTYSYGAGSHDSWVLKMDANGSIPDCDLIGDTSATPSNTTVTPVVLTATTTNTSIMPLSTSAIPQNTNASEEEQCFSEEPAAVPTLSEWGMIIFFLLLTGSALVFIREKREKIHFKEK